MTLNRNLPQGYSKVNEGKDLAANCLRLKILASAPVISPVSCAE